MTATRSATDDGHTLGEPFLQVSRQRDISNLTTTSPTTSRSSITRMAKKSQFVEAPLTEYEKLRARNMMRNNHRLQAIGLGGVGSMLRSRNEVEETSRVTNNDTDYFPKEDEDNDGEEFGNCIVEKPVFKSRGKKPGVKKTTKRRHNSATSAPMAPVRVQAPTTEKRKRMLEADAAAVTTRVTRQKATEIAQTNDRESQLQWDEGSSVQRDEGFQSMDEETTVLSHIIPTREQQQLMQDEEVAALVRSNKRRGSGLERMTKSLGNKVAIQIPEGMKRPEKPVLAAKFATEGGPIARSHTPVLPHFNEYKKDKTIVKDYIGKVAMNFKMDTESVVVQKVCTDMLQKISKNRRHKLKKKYFDPLPANQVSIKSPVPYVNDAEWNVLVTMWSSPKHKETCLSAIKNRKKVKFQQKTGSRSYVAHIYAAKEKRNGEEMSAVDVFRSTHFGEKSGYSEPVQNALAEMEKRRDALLPDGEEPKSDVDIVAEVLKEQSPSSTFLMNVGLQSSSSSNKSVIPGAVVAAQVVALQDKLAKSEMQAEAVREEMAAMRKKIEEAEAARDKEFEMLRKKAQEQDDKFAQMLAMIGARPTDDPAGRV